MRLIQPTIKEKVDEKRNVPLYRATHEAGDNTYCADAHSVKAGVREVRELVHSKRGKACL